MERAKILTAEQLNRMYKRFAHQFLEPFDDPSNLAIIGMQTRGVFMAKRIIEEINDSFDLNPDFGVLDTTFFRDDFRTKDVMPSVKVTEIPFDLDGRDIILVDDVLFTGRTIRSAMDAIIGYGRPKSIKLCCMVDRGHRELPVIADIIGLTIPTHSTEEVRVMVKELDGEDAVYLVEGKEEQA